MSGWTWTCPCGKSYSSGWLDVVQEEKKEHLAWHQTVVGRILGRRGAR